MPEVKKEATGPDAEEEVVEESGVAPTMSLTPQPTPPPPGTRDPASATVAQTSSALSPAAAPPQFAEAVLAFGRLVCTVAVAPPLAVPPGVLARTFPRVLAVAGFVPAALLPSPPSVAVHSVAPVLRGAADRAPRAFFALLQRALVSEHQHALVALDADWFAVLTAPYVLPFSGAERPSSPLQLLLLHVLAPGATLPGIGRLSVDSLSLCTAPSFAIV